MLKPILTHAAAIYLGAGIFAASLFGASIPAFNIIGKAWVVIYWPRMVYCAPIENHCDPMPPKWLTEYVFTFGGQANE
jgi:hypothetical protein